MLYYLLFLIIACGAVALLFRMKQDPGLPAWRARLMRVSRVTTVTGLGIFCLSAIFFFKIQGFESSKRHEFFVHNIGPVNAILYAANCGMIVACLAAVYACFGSSKSRRFGVGLNLFFIFCWWYIRLWILSGVM